MDERKTLHGLKERWTEWRFWTTDGGTPVATRRAVRLTDAQLADGLDMTVMCDSVDDLAAALEKQRAKEEELGLTAASEASP